MVPSTPAIRSMTAAFAVGVLVGLATALIVATWLFFNNGSPFAPGVLLWLAWGLYPGAAAILAVRSESRAAVSTLAVLIPSLSVAWFIAPSDNVVSQFGVPLGVAAGVLAGVRVGTAAMALRPGRRLVLPVIASGLAGSAVTLVFAGLAGGVIY